MNVVQTRPQDPLGFQWELRELSSVIHHFHIDHNAPCLPSNILNGTTVIPRRNWEQQFWKILGAKQGAFWSLWKRWDAILKVEETPGNKVGLSYWNEFIPVSVSYKFVHSAISAQTPWRYGFNRWHSGFDISNHGMVPLKYHATSSCFILKHVFPEN